jgi:oligo-1,6-glucosidase
MNTSTKKTLGNDLQKYLKRIEFESRDNGRTPFQWNDTQNAGFTIGKPWIAVNKNYKTINEAAEEKDPNSVLNYFRKVVKFRKDNLVLVYGKYTLLDKQNPDTYCYTRELDGKKLLVMLNFTNKTASTNTGANINSATLMIGNYDHPSKDGTLKPYEAIVYQLN